MGTIYHITDLGSDALAGLESARTRARNALVRIAGTQTPPPIPCPARPQLPDLPSLEVGGEKYGLVVDDADVYLFARGAKGAVERYFLSDLLPSQLLELTGRAEAWAAELERLADEYAAAVEQATADAVRSEDAAIRQLGEYIAAERAAAAAYEAERAAWIAEHGSSRLRRLAAEGIEHDAVYRDERLAAERPQWQWADGSTLPGEEPRNAPEAALDLLDRARQDDPDAVLRYIDSRRWVGHDDDPDYADVDPDECDKCDEDGEHRVGTHGYRCYAQFLGRFIMTRELVEV